LGREQDVEVIVVDWGSDSPLTDVLQLTPSAARIVKFIVVSPEITAAEQKDSPFAEVLALNAAVRRAAGEYIGRIDQDTLVGEGFLRKLFSFHERRGTIVPLENALLLSNRRCLSVRFTAKSPSLWAVDRYVRWFGGRLPLMDPLPPADFYQSYVGIWLLHRDIWYECGGYDERFIYMDWQEVDMMLRLTPKYALVNLGELTDHDLYHLNHGPARVPWSSQRNRKVNPRRDFEHMPKEDYPNDADWGLMRHDLDVTAFPHPPAYPAHGRLRPLSAEWRTFVAQVVVSAVQIVGDRLIMLARPGKWLSRLRVAQGAVEGKPVSRWPNALITRWRERSAFRQ
jgi:hypothetical protein